MSNTPIPHPPESMTPIMTNKNDLSSHLDNVERALKQDILRLQGKENGSSNQINRGYQAQGYDPFKEDGNRKYRNHSGGPVRQNQDQVEEPRKYSALPRNYPNNYNGMVISSLLIF